MDDSAAASTTSSGPRDRLAAVRESAAWVCAEARHVKLNAEAVAALAGEVAAQAKDHPVLEGGAEGGVGWGEEIHFVSGSEAAVVQYLFVVDALNFCFWPSEGGWRGSRRRCRHRCRQGRGGRRRRFANHCRRPRQTGQPHPTAAAEDHRRPHHLQDDVSPRNA